jgi:hypothetical protein
MMHETYNNERWQTAIVSQAQDGRDARGRSAPRRDKICNWIALGLLLAAWNFCDDDAVRPNHALVTVRAARDLQHLIS